MRIMKFVIMASVLSVIACELPGHAMAGRRSRSKQIVVRIDDTENGAPTVTVKGAPNGYDLYTGPLVADPAIEDGGLITLYGVDQFGPINPSGNGWRFIDPSLPIDATSNATDIVWIDHDTTIFGNGDLQIGFNTRNDGGYYINPLYSVDDSAGPATDKWVTVYTDRTIKVQFKAHAP